jgi:hypothetical protein
MNIPAESTVRAFFLISAASISTICSAESAPATPDNPLIEKKNRLSERIDSLDLIKQDLKRQGLVIAEIEQQQDQLRDSLKQYRSRLETAPKAVAKPAQGNGLQFLKSIQKPASLFDWIIIGTGIVAVFSGLLLAIGIIKAITRKRAPRRRRSDATPKPAEPRSVEKSLPAAEYPAPAIPVVTTPRTDAPPEISGVTQLRRRIEKYQITPGSFDARPEIPEPPPPPERTAPATRSVPTIADDASIEAEVVAAARSGLDVAAISRKFQLSSDHVALILKMAGHKPPVR